VFPQKKQVFSVNQQVFYKIEIINWKLDEMEAGEGRFLTGLILK
jgi:hypothetical protein